MREGKTIGLLEAMFNEYIYMALLRRSAMARNFFRLSNNANVLRREISKRVSIPRDRLETTIASHRKGISKTGGAEHVVPTSGVQITLFSSPGINVRDVVDADPLWESIFFGKSFGNAGVEFGDAVVR